MMTRLYDPAGGRFTSRDVLFGDTNGPASMNQYGYALGNPVTRIDLNGMASCKPNSGYHRLKWQGSTTYSIVEANACIVGSLRPPNNMLGGLSDYPVGWSWHKLRTEADVDYYITTVKALDGNSPIPGTKKTQRRDNRALANGLLDGKLVETDYMKTGAVKGSLHCRADVQVTVYWDNSGPSTPSSTEHWRSPEIPCHYFT